MKRLCWLLLLVAVMTSSSGCALLQLPFQLLNMAWNVAKQVPIPPPWLFL